MSILNVGDGTLGLQRISAISCTRLVVRRLLGLRGALLVCAALAALPRLWALDLAEFKFDEASWLLLAEDLVRRGEVPLAGMRSSQGITAPPHFAYVLAPIVALSRDPLFVTAAVAIANVAAVCAAFAFAWRSFGPLAGVVTGLLFAVNPWAVFWSRKIWQPDLMAPLAMLLFLALDSGVVQRRFRWAAATFPIAVLATLVHLSFAVLLPLLIAPLVVLVRARRWAMLAAGLALAVLVCLPTIVYEQRVGWEDYRDFRHFQSQRSATNLVGPGFALEVTTGWGAQTLVNVPIEAFTAPELVHIAAAIELGLLLVAVAIAGVRIVRGGAATDSSTRMRLALLLAWLALPMVLTLRHAMLLYPHYFLVLLPAPFLLIGSAAQFVGSQPVRFARIGMASFVVAMTIVVVLQAQTTIRLFDHLTTSFAPCYGMPLARTREIASGLTDFARAHGSTHLSIGGGLEVAYLLRSSFAQLDVPGRTDFALGAPRGVTRAQELTSTDASGVRVLAAWTPVPSIEDGRPRVALAWRADEVEAGSNSLRWQAMLDDVVDSGTVHSVASVRGEPVISYFGVTPAGPADRR